MGKTSTKSLEAMIDSVGESYYKLEKELAIEKEKMGKDFTLEKAKIEAIIKNVDNDAPGKVSSFFKDYGFDLLIGGGITGLLAMAVYGGATSVIEASERANFAKDVKTIEIEYQQWKAENPSATLDQKKQFVLDSSKKTLGETSTVGIAFEDSAKESVCMWNTTIPHTDVHQAISYDSTKTDCSRMDILASPEGFATVKDTSVKAAPAKTNPSTPSPINDIANTVMLVGGATLAVGAVGTGVGLGAKKIRANGRKRKDSLQAWDDLMTRHDVVRKSWALYELDPMKMLDYPVLSDMREKVTVELHAALRKANSARPVDARTAVSQGLRSEKYEGLVEALETAFHVAETEAKRIQWNKFSADEKKRLMTAKNLLSFVLDANGSEFERQAAYKRLAKEINGLVVLPDMTLKSLESTMRQMLTD